MPNLIDAYQTREMIPYLLTEPGERSFIRDAVFKAVRTTNASTVEIDKRFIDPSLPSYVSPEENGNQVNHQGFDTFAYKPPYVHEYKVLKPFDFDARRIGESAYEYTSPAQQLVNAMNEDLRELDTRLNRLEESQAIEIVTTGRLAPKDKAGNAFPVIDFGIKPSHKPVLTGPALWSDASKKKNAIIEDLDGWNTDLLVGDCQKNVRIVILGREAKKQLIRRFDPDNETGGLNSIRVQRGEIRPELLPNGVTYLGQLDDIGGAQIYCYSGKFKNPVSGDVAELFPANMVVMIAANIRAERVYGKIQNNRALQGLPRYPWIYQDPKGKADEIHLESAPLLILPEIDGVVAATVC
jgi:hypothetical protein